MCFVSAKCKIPKTRVFKKNGNCYLASIKPTSVQASKISMCQKCMFCWDKMQYCKNHVLKRKMELIIWLKQNPHPRWNPKSTHFTSVCFTKVKTTIVKTRFMRKMEKTNCSFTCTKPTTTKRAPVTSWCFVKAKWKNQKIDFWWKLKNVVWLAPKPQPQNQHLSQVMFCWG